MNFFSINPSQPPNRVDPIGERPEDKEERRRRSKYKGRSWSQDEDGEQLASIPTAAQSPRKGEDEKGLWGLNPQAHKARKLFETLTTLEEKVGQLLFFEMIATYDAQLQHTVELLLQTWQPGGIVFSTGEYRRHAYLVERFQEVSKTPLMMTCDFLLGLSYYYGKEPPVDKEVSPQHFMDLGKTVMHLLNKIGVHAHFDQLRTQTASPFSEQQIVAFRRGIRQAKGIIARELPIKKERNLTLSTNLKKKDLLSYPEFLKDKGEKEFVGLRTLTFLDLTKEPFYPEKLMKFFMDGSDALLLPIDRVSDAVLEIAKAVKMGRIREEELDRRVLKLLSFKVSNN